MRQIARMITNQRGVSLIELLVAVVVFVLLFLAVDSVFITAHRSTQQAELSVEVDQNARIAIERLTREIREADRDEISSTSSAVAFRSARPADSRVFCVNVPGSSDRLYNSACNYYGSPPVSGIDDYTPVWQRIVGYRLVATTGSSACGPYDLQRYVINQTSPTAPGLPNPGAPGATTQEAVIASCVQSLTLELSGSSGKSRFTVALKALGQRQVQGSSVPAQEILLTGEAWTRND